MPVGTLINKLQYAYTSSSMALLDSSAAISVKLWCLHYSQELSTRCGRFLLQYYQGGFFNLLGTTKEFNLLGQSKKFQRNFLVRARTFHLVRGSKISDATLAIAVKAQTVKASWRYRGPGDGLQGCSKGSPSDCQGHWPYCLPGFGYAPNDDDWLS